MTDEKYSHKQNYQTVYFSRSAAWIRATLRCSSRDSLTEALLQCQLFVPESIRHINDRTHPDFPDGIDDGSIIESVSHLYALRIGEGK
ncbi:MAG: hypothetical protein J6O51_01230 [Bacteroidales bacterium]|nr:hypothetical protein [Bacteroidales bacterium]